MTRNVSSGRMGGRRINPLRHRTVRGRSEDPAPQPPIKNEKLSAETLKVIADLIVFLEKGRANVAADTNALVTILQKSADRRTNDLHAVILLLQGIQALATKALENSEPTYVI